MLSCFQTSLDAGNRSDSWLGVSADPAIMDQPDGDRIEVVVLGPALFVGGHQICRFEDPEMVHDAIPGHLGEVGTQLAQCLAVLLVQLVEQEPSTGVVDRPEYLIHGLYVM